MPVLDVGAVEVGGWFAAGVAAGFVVHTRRLATTVSSAPRPSTAAAAGISPLLVRPVAGRLEEVVEDALVVGGDVAGSEGVADEGGDDGPERVGGIRHGSVGSPGVQGWAEFGVDGGGDSEEGVGTLVAGEIDEATVVVDVAVVDVEGEVGIEGDKDVDGGTVPSVVGVVVTAAHAPSSSPWAR